MTPGSLYLKMQDNKMKGYIVSMQKEGGKQPQNKQKILQRHANLYPQGLLPSLVPIAQLVSTLPINYLLNIKAVFKANNKTNKLSLLLAKLNVMDVWSDPNMETDWECARFKLSQKSVPYIFQQKGYGHSRARTKYRIITVVQSIPIYFQMLDQAIQLNQQCQLGYFFTPPKLE